MAGGQEGGDGGCRGPWGKAGRRVDRVSSGSGWGRGDTGGSDDSSLEGRLRTEPKLDVSSLLGPCSPRRTPCRARLQPASHSPHSGHAHLGWHLLSPYMLVTVPQGFSF